MARRVLIATDAPRASARLIAVLESEGYQPSEWASVVPPTAGDLSGIGLVVLERVLANEQAFELLRGVREHSEVPVIVLSRYNDVPDRVRAFRLGADDHVGEPFAPEELIERVRARLRRPRIARDEVIAVGSLKLDPAARQATLRESRIELRVPPALESRALRCRVGSAHIALSRDSKSEHS